MADCRWRAGYERERGRRDVPSVEAKLAKWGSWEGQDSLFDDDELLTPEIRAWREKQG